MRMLQQSMRTWPQSIRTWPCEYSACLYRYIERTHFL